MQLPEVSDNFFQERKGVIEFSRLVNEIRCVWRETPNADVGIDGQVEFVEDDGGCIGRLVAVQVKSGPSYLKGEDESIVYYPSQKHANYWREFPLPVILVIYDPATNLAYWVDARHQLRAAPLGETTAIRVPRNRVLTLATRRELFETTGLPSEVTLSVPDVVKVLANERSGEPDFDLSFFELFGFGIVDIGRKLFFSMHVCMEIAELRADAKGMGVGVGAYAHDFLDRYIRFLISQNLIYYDFSDYLIDRDVRQMSPTLLCPFTRRGQEVLRLMQALTGNVFHEALLRFHERFLYDLPERLEQAVEVQEAIRNGVLVPGAQVGDK